jgi:hypothetical protein
MGTCLVGAAFAAGGPGAVFTGWFTADWLAGVDEPQPILLGMV